MQLITDSLQFVAAGPPRRRFRPEAEAGRFIFGGFFGHLYRTGGEFFFG